MQPGVFITGTDTGCGKTFCSRLVIRALQQQGLRVAAMKPVASGASRQAGQLHNEDAISLQQACGLELPYESINPYVFEPAIAPHLAARQAGISIQAATIQAAYRQLHTQADHVLVEGVGGWRVPLNDALSVSDLPGLLNIPVILVVGMKLGCLNHALLSVESMQTQGVTLAGWIANAIDPGFECLQENIDTLETRLAAPCLAHIPLISALDPIREHQLAQNIKISWL